MFSPRKRLALLVEALLADAPLADQEPDVVRPVLFVNFLAKFGV